MKFSRRRVAFFAILLIFGALIFWLAEQYSGVLIGRDGRIDLTRSLIWFGLIVGSFFLHRKLSPGRTLKYGVIWIAILAALVLAYSFRHDARNIIDRITAELFPHSPRIVGDFVEIRAGRHGHFVLEAEVDGISIRFLVDTGASDVVLSPSDALRLGLTPENLTFNKLYRTANGLVRGAPVKIGRIVIGPILRTHVSASVNGAEMKQSLLGMSFLNRLSGYEVRGGRLRLKP